MACRPFAFGILLKDRERARSLDIRMADDRSGRYVIEDRRGNEPVRRVQRDSLADAIEAGARIWRHRLN